MIDTTKNVYFFDDRGKDDTILELAEVFYKDDDICLCTLGSWDDKILFDLRTGEVLTNSLLFWIATNDNPENWKT